MFLRSLLIPACPKDTWFHIRQKVRANHEDFNRQRSLMPTKNASQRPEGLPPGERWRAAYALDSALSRGRLIKEPGSRTRSDFQRDRDRIIHSTAFRRLKHKTQVFLEHEGDHYRTRLTHTLEVAQIARSIARALGLDEDLAETLALAHDLGHTPFGHAGERALDRVMADYGGFDHNAQSLKIVTALERRYAAFDGLNLAWETLEGLVKHNGPLTDCNGEGIGHYQGKNLPKAITAYDRRHPLELWTQASAEAQAAAIADDIAYNAHDIDDGLRARILTLEELPDVPFLAELLGEIDAAHPGLDRARTTHELQRRIITRLVEDAIAEAEHQAERLGLGSAEAVRAAPEAMVRFSQAMESHVKSIRGFLFPRLYRHPRIMAEMHGAERMIDELFGYFMEHPEKLPEEWHQDIAERDAVARATQISDFIAGMTDRYAIDMHRQLFGEADQRRG
jgi:dGTPase